MDLTKKLKPSGYRYVEIALKYEDISRFIPEVFTAFMRAGFTARSINEWTHVGELESRKNLKTALCITPEKIQGFATEEEIDCLLSVLSEHKDICTIENAETRFTYNMDDQDYMNLLSDHVAEILKDVRQVYCVSKDCIADDDIYIGKFIEKHRIICLERYHALDDRNAPDYLWIKNFLRIIRGLGLIPGRN